MSKPPLAVSRLPALLFLLVFLAVGFFFSLPCLCHRGVLKACFTMSLLLAIGVRLTISAFRNKLTIHEMAFYPVVYLAFTFWVDDLGH